MSLSTPTKHDGRAVLFAVAEQLVDVTVGQLVVVVTVVSELRQASYSKLTNITNMCSTDAPYTVKNSNKRECAVECLRLATCEDFNHKNDNSECALFLHKPLFYSSIPGCAGFKASYDLSSVIDARQYFGISGCSKLRCFQTRENQNKMPMFYEVS